MTLKRALVYGGNGALGRQMVDTFVQLNWDVLCVDYQQNGRASKNVVLKPTQTTENQAQEICDEVSKYLNKMKFNLIVNCAGGWQGGNVTKLDQLFVTSRTMWEQSVASSMVCANIATQMLESDGLLVFFGAHSALGPTPYAIGYGMAKSAVIQLTSSLAGKDSGVTATSICLCPVMLDTPANRQCMPNADTSSWTPLSHVSDQIVSYVNREKKVSSGSIIDVVTTQGQTEFKVFQR